MNLFELPIAYAAVEPGIQLAYRTAGSGPPLLLLHGHPQTHVIWHKIAAPLAQHHTLVLPDLRGYGRSSKPPGDADHANYSKRTMAGDLVTLMQLLGYEQFAVCAHDRGARVAHRLAVDHAPRVQRLMLLDIAPTLAMYEQTDMQFASAYWHWFFLIQKAPLPETLLSANAEFYAHSVMGSRHAGMAPFDPPALDDYLQALRDPATVHAMCEDYRAAASIDLEHDRASRDAGHMITCPVRVLWGAKGIIERCFEPLAEWRRVARDVSGRSVDCGHYIPEESPQELLREIEEFFA